jgi:hypothetical protein
MEYIGFARFGFNLVLNPLGKALAMCVQHSFVRRPSKEGGSLPLCVFRHREHSLFSAFLPPNKQRNATNLVPDMLGESISTSAQYVRLHTLKFIVKKSKCAGLA